MRVFLQKNLHVAFGATFQSLHEVRHSHAQVFMHIEPVQRYCILGPKPSSSALVRSMSRARVWRRVDAVNAEAKARGSVRELVTSGLGVRPRGVNRRFAPRGVGTWAALALLPACKKWRSRRACCWLTLTSFTSLHDGRFGEG